MRAVYEMLIGGVLILDLVVMEAAGCLGDPWPKGLRMCVCQLMISVGYLKS